MSWEPAENMMKVSLHFAKISAIHWIIWTTCTKHGFVSCYGVFRKGFQSYRMFHHIDTREYVWVHILLMLWAILNSAILLRNVQNATVWQQCCCQNKHWFLTTILLNSLHFRYNHLGNMGDENQTDEWRLKQHNCIANNFHITLQNKMMTVLTTDLLFHDKNIQCRQKQQTYLTPSALIYRNAYCILIMSCSTTPNIIYTVSTILMKIFLSMLKMGHLCKFEAYSVYICYNTK